MADLSRPAQGLRRGTASISRAHGLWAGSRARSSAPCPSACNNHSRPTSPATVAAIQSRFTNGSPSPQKPAVHEQQRSRQRRWGICRPTCIPMISMCFGANVDSLEVAALEIPEVFDGQHVDQLPVSVMSRGEEVAPHPDGNRAERGTPAERCRWVEPKLARCAPKPLLRGGSTPRAHSRERLGSRACFIEKRRINLAKWVSGGSGRLGGGHVDKQPVLGNGWE